MLRFQSVLVVPLLVPLAACGVTADPAALNVSTDGSSVTVELERPPSHTLGTLHATINGTAVSASQITQGGCGNDPDPQGRCWDGLADFRISIASLGSTQGLDVTVTEDADTFHFVADTLLAPRALSVLTPLDHPLGLADAIGVSSGVASDQISQVDLVVEDPSGDGCAWSYGYGDEYDAGQALDLDEPVSSIPAGSGTFSVPIADKGDVAELYWVCPSVAPGAIFTGQASVLVHALPAMTCDGPGLSCAEPVTELDQTYPLQLQF